MKILGLGLALDEGQTLYGVVPNDGLCVVTLPPGAPSPAVVAAAWRAALSSPTPVAGVAAVTVRAEAPGLSLVVLDEAPRRTILLGAPGALPRSIELDPAALEPRTLDGLTEDSLRRIAGAAGLASPDHFAAALSQTSTPQAPGAPDLGSALEQAYVAARRRAEALAAEVRSLDDQMTRSVVPDWLWIATGAGGIGVFMTVIALMYPELRVYALVGLVVASVIGFSLYGWRAYGELGTRARLLEARRERRAAREAARAEATRLGAQLEAEGGTPDAALLRLSALTLPPDLPAIIAPPHPTATELEALSVLGRQVVVVTEHVPADTPASWARPMVLEASPSE